MSDSSFYLLGSDDNKNSYWSHLQNYCARLEKKQHLLILMDAFPNYREWIPDYEQKFHSFGFQTVQVWIPEIRDSKEPEEIAQAISKADTLFVFGGDTKNYCQYYIHAEIIAALHDAIARGLDYIGLSTGVMLLGGEVMVLGEIWHPDFKNFVEVQKALAGQPDFVKRSRGFGIFPQVLFDVHFSERQRQPRLLSALNHSDKATLGFGIDSGMALLIHQNKGYCYGEGEITVFEEEKGEVREYLFHQENVFSF